MVTNRRSQAFSLDIMIAVGIFIVGIIVFLFLISGNGDKDITERLTLDSESIPERVIAADESSATEATFVIDNKVDEERLAVALDKDYSDLKKDIGVSSDFCIHFEDDFGNLIDLNDDPCIEQYSMGDPNLKIVISSSSGEREVACGERIMIC